NEPPSTLRTNAIIPDVSFSKFGMSFRRRPPSGTTHGRGFTQLRKPRQLAQRAWVGRCAALPVPRESHLEQRAKGTGLVPGAHLAPPLDETYPSVMQGNQGMHDLEGKVAVITGGGSGI